MVGGRYQGDKAPFVGDVGRIEPEDLAGSPHRFHHGDGCFVQLDAHIQTL